MGLAPRTVQCIPERLSRCPMIQTDDDAPSITSAERYASIAAVWVGLWRCTHWTTTQALRNALDRPGANPIIALRCCRMSGRWEEFWEARSAKTSDTHELSHT